jgi:SAM-dependent methyltransferase
MEEKIKRFDPKNVDSLNHKFRVKRFKFFKDKFEYIHFKENKQIRILDIGGTEIYWNRMGFPEDHHNVEILLLNLKDIPVVNHSVFKSVTADATDLSQFHDKEFDIVFSNSCIEHLYTFEKQIMMAQEIQRVGKRYYIQTPNYWFPIEPHWSFPFFQFLPVSFRVFLTNNLNLGHVGKQHNKEKAKDRVLEVKLLTLSEMKKLFPGSKIYKERFFGFVKSFCSYRFD